MRSAADPSADYAAEVAGLLWPEAGDAPYVTRRRHRAGQSHRDAYLFPSARRPRLLVPADVPGSSSMVRSLGSGRSALLVPMRHLLERTVHSRAFALAGWPMLRVPLDPGADSIERHLGACFGTEVRVGVLLGTRRVNQKPVLQIFDLQGTLIGYAKIGHNDLTGALVRREAESLVAVGEASPRSFRVPRLLHHGRWAGLEVLVMSPLATDARSEVPRAVRVAAMHEVSHLAGTVSPPLSDSRYWRRLRRTVRLLADTPDGGRLEAAARLIESQHGAEVLPLGGWHGDWGVWNMGMGDGVLKLWDWERYDAEVPLGFDGLHFAAQAVRPGETNQSRQEETFLQSVSETLVDLGVPVARHTLTLRLYLLTIAVRYVEALTYGATPPLRRRTAWVLALLERLSDHSESPSTEGRR